MMKDAYHFDKYFTQQRDELGSIFRVVGAPGFPEMLFVVDPKDIETVFRVGDISYPRRFPFTEWIQARQEKKWPLGIFLE